MYNFHFYKCIRLKYYQTNKLDNNIYGSVFSSGYYELEFNEPITLYQYTIIDNKIIQGLTVLYSPFLILIPQLLNFKEGDYIFTTDNLFTKSYAISNTEFWWNYLGEQQNIDLQKVNFIMNLINGNIYK